MNRRYAATEAGFQRAVIAYAKLHGWTVYSVPDSRRASASGYPDLTLAKRTARHPVIVAELKRVGQKPRPDQAAWLWCFAAAGIPAYTWRPADWPEIESVLGGLDGA